MSRLENEARKQIPFDAIVSEIQNCHSTRRSPCHKFIVQDYTLEAGRQTVL